MPFPPTTEEINQGFAHRVHEIALWWSNHPERPKPSAEVLSHWDRLIAEWINDAALPIFVRKHNSNRGFQLNHQNLHRVIIPTDNSPAQWAYARSVDGHMPTLQDIRQNIEQDAIPVAMAFRAVETAPNQLRCNLATIDGPNDAGWKVAHILPVGLGHQNPLEASIETLSAHFTKFMSPRNMFVIPNEFGGLAEATGFCDYFQN
jgi:hypothetical protein